MFDRYRFADEEPENTQPFVFSTLQRLYRYHRLADMAIGYDRGGSAVGKLAGTVGLRLAGVDREALIVINKYGPLNADGRYDVVIGFHNPGTNRPEKSINYYDTTKPTVRIGANPCDDMQIVGLLDEAVWSRDRAELQASVTTTVRITPCLLLDGPGHSTLYSQTVAEIKGA